MVQLFDIFRQDPDGNVLWIGVGESLEEAERKVAEASKLMPANYIIVEPLMRRKKVIKRQEP